MRKRVITGCLALLCAVMVLSLPVTAVVAGANDGNSNLTLHYYIANHRRPMAGVTFYAYKVGEYVSGPTRGVYMYQATRDFEKAGVNLIGLDFRAGAGILTERAYTLYLYTEAYSDEVVPVAKGQTDSEGYLTFENLEPGLYLVWGEQMLVTEDDGDGETREWTYIPQPFLIPLPFPSLGGFDHDVTVDVKYEQFPPPFAMEIDISVEKVWNPTGGNHPNSVTVVLLRNGTVVDEVTLSDENGWSYTWERLDSSIRWEVTEKNVPNGYTVTVDREGYHYTITNKTTPEEPPPETMPSAPLPSEPLPSETPPPETPPPETPPPETPPPETPPPDEPPDEPNLPQTGQLWWPVPLLLATGALMILIGAALFVRNEEEPKEFDELEE